ncbi:hypothetical protein GCM10022291_24560 [Postechiella marina]|uniref:VWFA domain-containing protein n=1 Tax=Postechiella marina TaxID=943941 RepID=A0ABP8CCC9_9FLAO
MKYSLIRISILFLILGVSSCKNDTEKTDSGKSEKQFKLLKNKISQNLNISFLLDLSDRINPKKYPNNAMEYYLRDVAYIKSVSEAFDAHLRGKKVRAMDDKIQLYFDPEPKNQNINKISNNLRFNVNRTNVTLETLDEIKDNYASKPIKIYDLAISDNKYVGSDTWRFFKTKVKDYCIEPNYRNILVVLTDGYIYHKDSKMKEDNLTTYLTPQVIRSFNLDNKDWQDTMVSQGFGFIPASEDLSNLEILVLGINPDKKNPYEEEIIMDYWSNWFDAMKVSKYEIKTAGLPTNMDNIIKEFILN